MIALIVAAGALALLYFWLVGHWFARILMSFVLWPCFAAIAFAILGSNGPLDLPPASAIFLAALVACASAMGAWVVSGYPIRHRIKAGWPVTLYRDGQRWHAEVYEGFIRGGR